MGFDLGKVEDFGKSFLGVDNNKQATTTSKSNLPAWAAPHAKSLLARQMEMGKRVWQPYGGNRFTGLLSSNPLWKQSTGLMSDAMRNPLDNPMYDSMSSRLISDFSRGTAANTDAVAARSGAFGSSGWAEQQGANSRALGDSLGNLQGQMYGQALAIAPQAGQMASAEQSDQQNRLDFEFQQWLEQQGFDQSQVNNAANVLASLVRGTGTQSATGPNPAYLSGMQAVIGLGAAAKGASGMMGGGGGGTSSSTPAPTGLLG